jgi:hypothetical protein
MKTKMKFFGLVALACFGISFMSCSDDDETVTCECTISINMLGYEESITVSEKAKKGDCKEAEKKVTEEYEKQGIADYATFKCVMK